LVGLLSKGPTRKRGKEKERANPAMRGGREKNVHPYGRFREKLGEKRGTLRKERKRPQLRQPKVMSEV